MKFNLYNQAPLNRVETLRALDTALAQKGVTMVQVGDNSVIATDKPGLEVAPAVNSPTDQLPESSSYMLTTVHLKKADPDLVVRTLATASQLPGSVIYMPSANLLILRDYSSGIRRMLRYLQESDP